MSISDHASHYPKRCQYLNANNRNNSSESNANTKNSNEWAWEEGVSYQDQGAVRHLYLVRHGQYQRLTTQGDGNLTEKGQQQAVFAANYLATELPEDVLFDSLTHSDMIRTRETAVHIYKRLKILKKIDLEYIAIDTDWREQNWFLGFILNGNWRSLKRDYFRSTTETINNHIPTFEIVVAHRNIIAHVIELITMIQPDKNIAFNASITHVIVDEKGANIDYAYKHTHIPLDMLTMWEIFLPNGESKAKEPIKKHTEVTGVKGIQRRGCYIRLLVSCLR
ncbi:unnamed protein product [Didymodactylos carnosus]|uniref:Serine/threonine-protein phosphatase PGAM5, mitochondrial n=1 Tax=Didymodactylos carnosus TaxID=1234261 RepID=A0A813X8E2_9BILA|nr:unnamed protein product [Didymodactylos carnosus]CAF0866341.1 unnamed protein product [Didymodactylos carnosus]CAF3513881.1 unnamed protein product [Didymodactylos carnosus]CAF3653832.1 unnamed protein product [Didymodactylos carnosus]